MGKMVRIGLLIGVFLLVFMHSASAFKLTVSNDTTIIPDVPVVHITIDKIYEYPTGSTTYQVWFKSFNEVAGEVDAIVDVRSDKHVYIGFYDHASSQIVWVAKGSVGDSFDLMVEYDDDSNEVISSIYYNGLKIYERSGYYTDGSSKDIDKLIVDFNDAGGGKMDFVIQSSALSGFDIILMNALLPTVLIVAMLGLVFRWAS